MSYLVSDFLQDVRTRVGDSSKSISDTSLMTYLNTALRRLVRQRGLEKLVSHHDTWELAYLNKDGTPSASWDLGNVGAIIDITKLRVLKTVNGRACDLEPTYLDYNYFVDCYSLPEQNEPGDVSYYTYEQLGSITRLVFDRPPQDLVVLDMVYSAYPPRITDVNAEFPIAYEYADVLEEFVIILQKIESTDDATARALYEDLDLMTTELVELLARKKSNTPSRRIARSW